MDRTNHAHRLRDRNDAVTRMTVANPVHRQRDRDDVVIEMTVAVHTHHRHREDQIDGVATPGGASKEGKAGRAIDPSVTSMGRTIGVGAQLALKPAREVTPMMSGISRDHCA